MQAVEESGHASAPLGGQELLQRLAREVAVACIVKVLARRPDYAKVLRHQLVGM